MKQQLVTQPSIKLVGLSARTNNQNEMNPAMAKIGNVIGQYWQQGWQERIPNCKNPAITFSAYTNYDSNEHGDYTYFYGTEVLSFDGIPNELTQLIIPAGTYQKITTEQGAMPMIVINAWMTIWQMTPQELGGKRCYDVDFEMYDARAQDPTNSEVDIFIGIK